MSAQVRYSLGVHCVLPLLILGSLVFSGCGNIKYAITGEDPFARPVQEVPAHLRGSSGGPEPLLARVRLDDEGGEPLGIILPGAIPSEDEIVWTDPDNPDAPLEGLEETLATPKATHGGWSISYSEATRRAVREGRPLLIWFTDTQRSPLGKALSVEVFSDPTFAAWSSEHLIRLRLDFNVKGEDENETLQMKAYLATLKKRYKVGGLPTVLVMAPDGTVTGRYKGYKRGSGDFYFGRIKNATQTAENQTEEWMASMEKKGYRVWKDRKDRQIFAKLLRYLKGELLLVEPSGKRIKAKEKELSDDDQLWIQGELAKRER